jgi:uncharacterized protein
MKKRWFALALAPIALGLMLDNALPYMPIDHMNRPVEQRSQLWNEANLETLAFASSDGTKLAGWWVPRSGATKTLILLHSLGGNREDLSVFAEPIWQAGFNLVMLDMRSHGMSQGKYFTYGFHEWKDVQAAIDLVSSKQPNQTFSILGVSGGGPVAIAAAAHDQRIRKVVTIGAFADLNATIEAQTKLLPGFWRDRALGRSQELAAFNLKETSAKQWIAQVKVPVMIAHGDADTYIPFQNGEELFAAAQQPKVLYRIAGASHDTMTRSPDLQQAVIKFLQ